MLTCHQAMAHLSTGVTQTYACKSTRELVAYIKWRNAFEICITCPDVHVNVYIGCLFINKQVLKQVDLFRYGVFYVLEDRLQSHCVTFVLNSR